MKRNELSKVMRRAWVIARATGKTFAVCLAKSWQLYRLTKRMRVARPLPSMNGWAMFISTYLAIICS